MTSARRVEATYTNHDTNLVDVTLRVTAPAHGAVAATAGAGRARDEVVHTTANHPWLTADHGWLPASFMRIGEPIVRADGTTATVAAIRAVPGAAPMWDLTVGDLHDFAVGSGQYVVHNCDSKSFYGNNKDVFESEGEAKATYRSILKGRAHDPTFEEDGTVFENREGELPGRPRGQYREWTVQYGDDFVAGERRGVSRVVMNRSRNEFWFSRTHYGTAQDYGSRAFYKLWWR